MGAMTENRTNDTAGATSAKGDDHERIAKVLARAGLCSRREAEEWIAAGRVAVDGVVLTTPAVTVGAANRITVDGAPLPVKERTRLWLFHKPRGLVTTTSDPEGRPTVFSVLPDDMPRVITVGRLDINTEGLLLLTNDGGLARVLELPSTGWLRRYRVRAFGEIDQAALDELKQGVSLDGVDYGPIEAVIDRVQGSNIWLVVGLREGKNREVKRVLGSLGLTVNRLIRISFGPFQLADLEEGEIREIRGRVLRDQLGKRLVEESGADFEAPVVHHLHGEDPDEAPKRRIKGFTPAAESDERPRGRTPRTKMEFIGTGERRRDDDRPRGPGPKGGRDDRGGRFDRDDRGPRGGRDDRGGRTDRDDRGDRPFRSEGGRGRPNGDRPKSAGFRDRSEGGEGKRWRSEGRHDGGERSAGFRGRPDGERPKSAGFRDRPDGDRPKSGGFRDRADGDRPKSGGFRDRADGDRPKSGGFRDRPGGDRPKSGGFRDRPGADAPRGEGPRGRPTRDQRPRDEGRSSGPRDRGDRPERAEGRTFRSEGYRDGGQRSSGFRGRPDGGEGRSHRSEGFRGRPEGGGGRSSGFRDRPEGGDDRPARPAAGPRPDTAGFGPRGPRGLNPGGRKGPRDEGPKSGPRGGKGGAKGGPKGGPKGGGKGRGRP